MYDDYTDQLVTSAFKARASGDENECGRLLRNAAEWCWNRGNQHDALDLIGQAIDAFTRAGNSNSAALASQWYQAHGGR
jgi:hypothetical protein